ncbi:MAG: hypothetical protein ACOYOO_10340, partial [Saprospiraceae bacterium]
HPKNISPPQAAKTFLHNPKLKFKTHVFFMILRSKIMKNTWVSKENFAAGGGNSVMIQLQNTIQWRTAGSS